MRLQRPSMNLDDLLARLKSAAGSAEFSLFLEGGGVPQQQRIGFANAVIINRGDLAEIIRLIEVKTTRPTIELDLSNVPEG